MKIYDPPRPVRCVHLDPSRRYPPPDLSREIVKTPTTTSRSVEVVGRVSPLAKLMADCLVPEAEGCRNQIFLRMGGVLLNEGFSVEEAKALAREACVRAGVDAGKTKDLVRAVVDTFRRAGEGIHVSGEAALLATLEKAFGEEGGRARGFAFLREAMNARKIAGGRYSVGIGPRPSISANVYDKKTKSWTTVRLANFSARIEREINQEDGAGAGQKTFEIRVWTLRGERVVRVKSEDFAGMGWVIAKVGAVAAISATFAAGAGVREAIQLFSEKHEEEEVRAHTGWIGEKFLSASGALDAEGMDSSVAVRLEDTLARYSLECRGSNEEAREVIEAWRLLAPAGIAAPILCAALRAPLREALPFPASLFLAGVTGSRKTEIAAAALGFFGRDWSGERLPGNWESTANRSERDASSAKDVLFVLDDFVPGARDIGRLHRDADRLLRGVANVGGRGRLNKDAQAKTTYHARGVVISTGEDVPRGESLRGRLYVIEFKSGHVNLNALTEIQRLRANGALARVMGGYIQYLAPWIGSCGSGVKRRVAEIREELGAGAHARTATTAAHLLLGLEAFAKHLRKAGIYSAKEVVDLLGWARKGVKEASEAQSEWIVEARPAEKFLQLLRSAIAAGRAHIAGVDGGRPDQGGLGWRGDSNGGLHPQGERAGWTDGALVWIETSVALGAVNRLAREGDQALVGISVSMLHRTLFAEKVILRREEKRRTYTVRKVLEGAGREVIEMDLSVLSANPEEEGSSPHKSGGDGVRAGEKQHEEVTPSKNADKTDKKREGGAWTGWEGVFDDDDDPTV